MKKLFSILCATCLAASAFAQDQFSIFGGYEHFPEMHVGKGYNVGIEYKHYMNKRFYAVANFHSGVNDGSEKAVYTNKGIDYNFDLHNSVRDYMLGFGIGVDLMHINRHKIYIQGTAGIGSSSVSKDGISTSPTGAYDIVKTHEENSVRFAVSASAGYDYQLTDWLSVGVNYTGWQIGYDYKNSVNAKLGFTF